MIEPNGQKIYLTTDDLSDVYTEHENPTDAALDVLEGEQSYIVVDGKELAIGYDSGKDVIIVETTDVSDEIARKARQLMQLFVANELYTKADIKGKNGYAPDDNYPYSVNLIVGNTTDLLSIRIIVRRNNGFGLPKFITKTANIICIFPPTSICSLQHPIRRSVHSFSKGATKSKT